MTASRTYGVDIPLTRGLNVLRAENTSGKSTALLAIVYVLGLERAIGTRLDVPLPYAMRERIRPDRTAAYEPVVESHVTVEIENSKGDLLTVRRDVAGGMDRKLARTWPCSIDDVDFGRGSQRDFFLHDPGAATREDGFHRYLAEFIGWNLPTVPRFDGDEVPLYIEALFPLFFVEQKRGWSTVLGPLPTQLGIQDLPRRVMEFLLDLDAGKVRRRRTELRRERLVLETRYRERRKELAEGSKFVRLTDVPNEPSAAFAQGGEVHLTVFYEDEWHPLAELMRTIRAQLSEFESTELAPVEDATAELHAALAERERAYGMLTSEVEVLRQDYQLALSERSAFEDRVRALETDLRRNQDAVKLQELGSTLGASLSHHQCPTCHQSVDTELLPTVSRSAMGLPENIAFLRSQLDLYRAMLGSANEGISAMAVRYQALREELHELQAQIRSVKKDLLRPARSPTRSELEGVVRLEARLERWAAQQERVDASIDDLRAIAAQWVAVQVELKELGSGQLTQTDKNKTAFVQSTLQRLLAQFGFSSFRPTDITLSLDDFRPQVTTEDENGDVAVRDIGFEASASDGVRLKWAYFLSLLRLSSRFATNHLGVLIFDEPGQQQMKEADLSSFFVASAESADGDRQLIVTTSQVLERVEQSLRDHTVNIVSFDGLMLQPLAAQG